MYPFPTVVVVNCYILLSPGLIMLCFGFIMHLFFSLLFYTWNASFSTDNHQEKCINVLRTQISSNTTCIKPSRVIINPYKYELMHHVPYKPFSSLCIRCAMCLAIANEINYIYNTIYQNYKKNNHQDLALFMINKLNSICNSGFKNYNLREYNKLQVLSDKFDCTSNVKSRKEESYWTDILREKCSFYIKFINFEYLYNHYLKGYKNITNYLCRNNGVLRDCTNLDYIEVNFPKQVKSSFFGF